MVEQWAPPVPLEGDEGPTLLLTIRNTANLRHNWGHDAFGGYGAGKMGGTKYFVAPPIRGGSRRESFFELAVEARSGDLEGPLISHRIKRCTFDFQGDAAQTCATVERAPFCHASHAADPISVLVTVEVEDGRGQVHLACLSHEVTLTKQVAATVYSISEGRMDEDDAWTQVEITNTYVPHDEAGPPPRRPAPPADSGLSPATIDANDVVENLGELGRGSFGVVLKVRTLNGCGLPTYVAVKQQLSTNTTDQFWLEAKAAASLPAHTNVAAYLGWGIVFGKLSIVFEYCEEGDLNTFMKKATDTRTNIQSLPPATILDLTRQIAAGMAHIHANRLYHRDLKPNNVLLTRRGAVGPSGLRAVVTDLGLAKNLATEVNLSQSMQGSQVGTYVYMAPETIAKSVFSQGTDVWSFGTVVWQLLTGLSPYSYLGSFNPVAVAFQVGFGHLSPEQLNWPAPFHTFMGQAFVEDHHVRPTFTTILKQLADGASQFTSMGDAAFQQLQVDWSQQLKQMYGSGSGGRAPRPPPLSQTKTTTTTTTTGTAVIPSVAPVEQAFKSLILSPESDVGTPQFDSRRPSFPTVAAPLAMSPLTQQVSTLVRYDYNSILAEYGFDTLDDFDLYTEDDLVAMGFKKVHARKLLRAASGSVAGTPPVTGSTRPPLMASVAVN